MQITDLIATIAGAIFSAGNVLINKFTLPEAEVWEQVNRLRAIDRTVADEAAAEIERHLPKS